ncbi:hypothetical protein KPSA3_04377 [Pseudomonas syringae pv. actinidiae]|uniref:Uncharacterized protein n=1 Tax=Pseudomonas syringae pv. actinidiae TaxID=103796 RepID=A0AAN4TLY6_PSESF|nr:hypothetical protein KPSA3_04377 [Pseudomonas syringae pv. actinidiae]
MLSLTHFGFRFNFLRVSSLSMIFMSHPTQPFLDLVTLACNPSEKTTLTGDYPPPD